MHLLPFNKLGTGYIEQQWFLNYSSGFIRRGLFGELVNWMNLSLGDVYFLFRFVITLLFTIFFGIVWRSFGYINSKNIPYFLIVVTSPIFYSAFAKLNGRFDLFFCIAITIIFLIKNKKYSQLLLIGSLVPFGLVHEIWLLMFVPLYLLLSFREYGPLNIALMGTLNSVTLLILWNVTKIPPHDVSTVCQDILSRLSNFSTYTCVASGSISFSTQEYKTAITDVIYFGRDHTLLSAFQSALEYIVTTAYILIGSLPILYVIYCSKLISKLKTHLLIFSFIIFVILSLVALDWGRFLTEILQILILYFFINNRVVFKNDLSMRIFLILMTVNLVFIKLVFTRINLNQVF